ncbi:L-serine dehydratase [Succinivibrio dextrinosolvens]|uniref:L-serine ammonia-lyase n=1 Tax=Succinivibrio dextrinosolvens TaxID=83771 RepID=UPI0008E62682|nr:L-serine ammonia-lyase [Succinivibrio dextrinosolvens]SFS76859.1 L-serine dehydratase [Succinivibrio dextrinosolvens]
MSEYKYKMLNRPPVETAIFDFFKVGPGPSSSHTIGPMKAGNDFYNKVSALPDEVISKAAAIEVTLLGSLSATGVGHGTDSAVLAGILGNIPEKCPGSVLQDIKQTPEKKYEVRIKNKAITVGLDSIKFGPVKHDSPYNNTMLITLLDANRNILFEVEYYSVGGGFIQWKGWKEEERGKPVHPYGTMRELHERLQETGLTMHELILENEMAITGLTRPQICEKLDELMDVMYDSVKRGLNNVGKLPGHLGVWRKAQAILEQYKTNNFEADRLMGKINSYAFAVSEENASGGVIVTAPTCGAAGVIPALLYAMRNDMSLGDRALREGLLASAAVGMLCKHNAGIAGAEVGCQGEIGVASSMAAAMLAHARGYDASVVENAAEIALEHHLGLTCDPVGGYVQIPCIERNAMGAIKAYNAVLLATAEKNTQHKVSLDAAIMAMNEIGRNMNIKFKETSAGGLAVSVVEC